MKREFFIAHREILPDFVDMVISVRDKIDLEKASVSEACKAYGLSRSTYYKYKDKVFKLDKNYGKKAILSFKTDDKRGVLSNILKIISEFEGNVLTINQDLPIRERAFINIMIETKKLKIGLNELVTELKKIEYVRAVEIVVFE